MGEVQQYREAAMMVKNSAFDRKEKDRHYMELLAHLRARFGRKLGEDEELKNLYEWIVSLIGKP